MSEYQYYEFRAIDRPLTARELAVLRSVSTRGVITPTSFTNHYNWGDFKADPNDWIAKYFDAFLYVANWGSHILMLRLPARFLSLQTVKPYSNGDNLKVRSHKDNVILSFSSDQEDEWDVDDGTDWLPSLITLRNDLIQGDLRALYLGWLCSLQGGMSDKRQPEPPVPPGLAELNAPLRSLAEFLWIDPDLLATAASASVPLTVRKSKGRDILAWTGALPAREKDVLLAKVIADETGKELLALRRRFAVEQSDHPTSKAWTLQKRTVGQLLGAAEASRQERERIERKKQAEWEARQRHEAALARAKYLGDLASREPAIWLRIDNLVASHKPKNYDEALGLLRDLRDLARQEKREEKFKGRIQFLRKTHEKKPSFIRRLNRAKL